jgi:hypothetical protein
MRTPGGNDFGSDPDETACRAGRSFIKVVAEPTEGSRAPRSGTQRSGNTPWLATGMNASLKRQGSIAERAATDGPAVRPYLRCPGACPLGASLNAKSDGRYSEYKLERICNM